MISRRRGGTPFAASLALAGLVVACVVPLAHAAVTEAPARIVPRERKSLERRLDPVVLEAGTVVAGWVGTPTSRIRAFAITGDRLVPVPYQIDPVGPDGRPLYALGIRNDATRIRDALGPDDEIVLVASESGDRPPADFSVPGAIESVEVLLEDPARDGRTPGRGWFLLARFDTDPPPALTSPRVLVAQKMKHNLVFSDAYTTRFYDFYPSSHSLVPSDIRIPVAAGGTEEDFLDRFKWRVQFSLLWGLYRVSFDEQKVNVRVLAWSEGPVRIRRLVTMRVRLPLGIEGPSISIHADFYPHLIQVPLEIEIPTAPRLFTAHTDFILGADLSPVADGMQFRSSVNTEGFLVDGWMSGPELEASDEPAEWWLWTGKAGTVVQRSYWDPAYRRAVEIRHEYIDDLESPSPPEEFPGERGALYERMRVDDIEIGTYHGLLEWWFPGWEVYEPGDEQEILDVYARPLVATVGDWTGEAFPLAEELRP